MRTRTGRPARLLWTSALAIAACLLVAAIPAYAAPAVAGPSGAPAVDRSAGFLHGLGEALSGLWTGLAVPLDRLFAASGTQVDPDGTAGSGSSKTAGAWSLDEATADNGLNIDPNG